MGREEIMSDIDLSNYVEVHERIEAFYEKYPDGCLQSFWQLTKFGEDTVIVVEAHAYRGKEDEKPGIGLASEPYPGTTPYTRTSELMNAETSAWGRALAALGFKVDRGIASANEVRGKSGGAKSEPSEKQLSFFEKLLLEAGLSPTTVSVLVTFAKAELTGGKEGSMSKAIDGLKTDETKAETIARLEVAAKDRARKQAEEGEK